MTRVKLKIPLPELNENDLPDAIQRLWVTGHSDRECMRILGLSKETFNEAKTVLRAVSINRATAEQAFAEFADVFTIFKLRCDDKLKQLKTLLEHSTRIDPLDGCAMNPSGARRVIREMTKIDQALMTATTQLLLLKLRLGLIVTPEQPQLSYDGNGRDVTENGNGHGDGILFSRSNVREAWRLRELQKQKLLN